MSEASRTARDLIPILDWIPDYRRAWLSADVLAGLTIVALLVPEGMAYAQLAGLSPEAAFYAAPPALVLYAIFGSSRRLVVVVSSTQAVFSAATVAELAPAGSLEFVTLTAALAIMAGIVSIVAGFIHAGRLAAFFSASVLLGFVSGLALVIAIRQVPKLLGLHGSDGDFFEQVRYLVAHLAEIQVPTAIVGLGSVLAMAGLERANPRIPAALVVLVAGIAASAVVGLEAMGVAVVGTLPSGLVAPRLPDVDLTDVIPLFVGAVGLTLLNFAEAYGPARDLAQRHGERIDPDQELIAMGASNIGAGLFQGFPVGSSLSKTAAAERAGIQTQAAGLIAAAATVLVALFLTPLFAPLPEAVLGAIVIVAVAGMFKLAGLQRLWRISRPDLWLALAALMGVLVLGVLPGLVVAVAISIVLIVVRASDTRLVELGVRGTRIVSASLPGVATIPGVLLLRSDEPLFFANIESGRDLILAVVDEVEPPTRAVCLDLSASVELDVPSADALKGLGDELHARGVAFHLSRVRADVGDMLERSNATASLDGIHRTTGDALAAIVAAEPSLANGLPAAEREELGRLTR